MRNMDQVPQGSKAQKDPHVAAVVSLLCIGGAGHLMSGEPAKFLVYLLGRIAVGALTGLQGDARTIAVLAVVAVAIIDAVDVFGSVEKLNKGEKTSYNLVAVTVAITAVAWISLPGMSTPPLVPAP